MLDVHRWVVMPTIPSTAAPRSTRGGTATEDVSPPYSLMEHHPLAAFVNGRGAAVRLGVVLRWRYLPVLGRLGQVCYPP